MDPGSRAVTTALDGCLDVRERDVMPASGRAAARRRLDTARHVAMMRPVPLSEAGFPAA